MKKVLLINGPNLKRLGTRKVEIYGSTTLQEIENNLISAGQSSGYEIHPFCSNSEGQLIDYIDEHRDAEGIIINPGALILSGWSLRDALEDVSCPVIEVHISNVWARESFRHESVISGVATGVIAGLGIHVYKLAFQALLDLNSGISEEI